MDQVAPAPSPTRRAPYRLAAATVIPSARKLETARRECAASLADFVHQAVAMSHGAVTPLFTPALLQRDPSGVGKTQGLIDALNRAHLPADAEVLIVAPTHELLGQIHGGLQVPAVHVKGRPEGMCEFPDITKAMNRRRLPMHEHICSRVCPVKAGCTYYLQFEQRAQGWLVTPQMALSKRFQYVTKEGKAGVRQWLLVAFDDVDPVAAMVESVTVDVGSLLRAAGHPNLADHQQLLIALAQLASDPKPVVGRPMWTRLGAILGGAEALREYVEPLPAGALPKEPEPELPSGRMPTVAEIEAQLPAFIEPLFGALRDEGARFFRDEPFAGRVEAGRNGLTVYHRHRPTYLTRPVVLLDATPDQAAWEHLLPQPLSIAGSEPVEWPANVEVVQVATFFNGKTAMSNEPHRERVFALVDALLPSLPRPVLLVTFLKLEDELRRRYQAAGVEVRHFWSLRGLNIHSSAGALVVVGCPTPSVDDLLRLLAAFYNGADLDATPVMAEGRYESVSGIHNWAVQVLTFADPRISSALATRREGELLQVVHRLRPLVRKDSSVILLLTEQPVPSLPVHLTGVEGVRCPNVDPVTQTVLDAILHQLGEAGQQGRNYVDSGDVAEAAFGNRSRQSRDLVTRGCRLDEAAHHLRVKVRRVRRVQPQANGGWTEYDTWEISA